MSLFCVVKKMCNLVECLANLNIGFNHFLHENKATVLSDNC